MKRFRSIAILGASAALMLVAGFGCIPTGDYRAFVYRDRQAYVFNPAYAGRKAAGPAFNTYEACETWASKEAAKAGDVPWRCGYRCRYEAKYDEVICEDDTPTEPAS